MKGMKGYYQGDMKPEVKDMAKPKACFAQSYDQSTTNYIARQDRTQVKQASKLRGEAFKGRYSGGSGKY